MAKVIVKQKTYTVNVLLDITTKHLNTEFKTLMAISDDYHHCLKRIQALNLCCLIAI